MKKLLVLFLVGAFLVTVAGCASKSEYDKLMGQKVAAEKKVGDLEKTIAARDMEIRDLKNELKKTQVSVQSLTAELNKLKASAQ